VDIDRFVHNIVYGLLAIIRQTGRKETRVRKECILQLRHVFCPPTSHMVSWVMSIINTNTYRFRKEANVKGFQYVVSRFIGGKIT
jgi:hypothetical protein